jgi:hypothetical protein
MKTADESLRASFRNVFLNKFKGGLVSGKQLR